MAALLWIGGIGATSRAASAQDTIPVTAPPPPADTAVQPTGVRLDSLVVTGNRRLNVAEIRSGSGLRAGSRVTAVDVQQAIRRLMATGQYESVSIFQRGGPAAGTPATNAVLVVQVVERPILAGVEFRGLESVNSGTVRDSVGWQRGQPLDPQRVARTEAMIRDLLTKKGIELTSVDTSLTAAGGPDTVRLAFIVREGKRLAIADIEFRGNRAFDGGALRGAMKTSEEGFFWFRPGRFDRSVFEEDLRTRLPDFYAGHGYIDFAVTGDTLIVDPETGKARLVVDVSEGPQYRLGEFTVEGNSRYPTEQLKQMFTAQRRTVLGLPFGGVNQREQGEVFDRVALEDATRRVSQLYRNNGYLYAEVNPAVERVPAAGSGAPVVNVTWKVREGSPFYIRNVQIAGNTYTHESVIRDRLWILPGSIYSDDLLLQSYQSISGLGFFETPMPLPDIEPKPDSGVVDITFHVKEKQTGNINFGTSVGGGYAGIGGGISGFLGYSQPNLFGQGKQASLRVEYGLGRSRFEASYSDPALFGTRNSASISAFHTGDRYSRFSNGRLTRTGGSLQFGVPVPGLLRTRAFVGYSLSRSAYTAAESEDCTVDSTDLFCLPNATASTLSLSVTRDTKNSPLFPTAGTSQTVSLGQTGGALGGDGNFRKLITEGQWWVPAGTLGGGAPGSRPIRFTLGLQARAGSVFGNASRFPFEQFRVGGVQYGESLRGYPEQTITPFGYSERCENRLLVQCLGSAFFTVTAQYAARLNDNLSLQVFGDAGNAYRSPAQFDPTRLFRGAGIGATVVTPFGPIGLDAAYGFDRPQPGWEIHFKLGQTF